MGVLLGLAFGTGILLIWQSLAGPSPTLRRPSSWARRRREMLLQAGIVGVGPGQLALLQLSAGLLTLLLALLVTRTLTVSACFAVFAALAPVAAVRRLRRRRTLELREVWPEVVDNLSSAVRAGLSLPEALSALGTGGPEALRPAFLRFAADYRSTGRFSTCLDRLRDELADPVADRIVESLRMAREVGGTDLGRLLRTLSAFLREDARARAELETRQGWTVNAARLAVAAPWLVLLLLATQSTTLSAYDTPGGTVVLAAGAGSSLIAYRLMLFLGRLPQDPRVLQ